MSTAASPSRGRLIAYWIATVLFCAPMVMGGIADVTQGPEVIKSLAHLGYPGYFAVLIGVWKLLGAVALLAPGFARLKEWAYAGFVFDLTGASVSHAAVGDPIVNVLTPLLFGGVMAVSYVLRPPSRQLLSPSA